MTQSHAPSAKLATREQIGKLCDKLSHRLQKNGTKSKPFLAAVKAHGDEMVTDCAAIIQKYLDMVSTIIVHYVSVDRSRTPQQALDATGRKQYVDKDVVDAMPRGTGKKVKMTYFKPDPSAYKNGVLTCDGLAAEYKKRKLKPDPQAQIDDNAANPAFADTTPNACQWVDKDGKYCCATFGRWRGGRDVRVDRDDDDWVDGWSFGGVPDESSASAV